jgi:hypothetical protein
MIDIDHKITDFLQDIATNYEQLTPFQKKLITDFFYSFHFLENHERQEDTDEKKMLKYISLGWYIYENILQNNN